MGTERLKVKSDLWINQILSSLNDEKIDEWLEFEDIKYRIHTRQFDDILSARYMMAGCATEPGWFDV